MIIINIDYIIQIVSLVLVNSFGKTDLEFLEETW